MKTTGCAVSECGYQNFAYRAKCRLCEKAKGAKSDKLQSPPPAGVTVVRPWAAGRGRTGEAERAAVAAWAKRTLVEEQDAGVLACI